MVTVLNWIEFNSQLKINGDDKTKTKMQLPMMHYPKPDHFNCYDYRFRIAKHTQREAHWESLIFIHVYRNKLLFAIAQLCAAVDLLSHFISRYVHCTAAAKMNTKKIKSLQAENGKIAKQNLPGAYLATTRDCASVSFEIVCTYLYRRHYLRNIAVLNPISQ